MDMLLESYSQCQSLNTTKKLIFLWKILIRMWTNKNYLIISSHLERSYPANSRPIKMVKVKVMPSSSTKMRKMQRKLYKRWMIRRSTVKRLKSIFTRRRIQEKLRTPQNSIIFSSRICLRELITSNSRISLANSVRSIPLQFNSMMLKTWRITVMFALRIQSTLRKLCKLWTRNRSQMDTSWLLTSTLARRTTSPNMDQRSIQSPRTWQRPSTLTSTLSSSLMISLRNNLERPSLLKTPILYRLNSPSSLRSTTMRKLPHINLPTFSMILFQLLKKPFKPSIYQLCLVTNHFWSNCGFQRRRKNKKIRRKKTKRLSNSWITC